MPNELLEVRNKTTYDTRDIRSAVLACEKYLDMTGQRVVKVVYSRNRGRQVTGYAYYPSCGRAEGVTVKLRLPKVRKGEVITEELVQDFLWLVEHELSHSRGVSHRVMRGSPTNKVHSIGRRPAWAEGLQLRLKAPKAKPTMADRVSARTAMVEAGIARWQRRLKLAKTKLAKLKAKQRYYQRQTVKLPHANSPLYQGLHQLDESTLMAAKGPSKE